MHSVYTVNCEKKRIPIKKFWGGELFPSRGLVANPILPWDADSYWFFVPQSFEFLIHKWPRVLLYWHSSLLANQYQADNLPTLTSTDLRPQLSLQNPHSTVLGCIWLVNWEKVYARDSKLEFCLLAALADLL